MIDMHFHVLPSVDDGPDTLQQSIELIKQAYNQGVRQIVATPHYRPPKYIPQNIQSAYTLLNDAIADSNIDIKLHLGREVFADVDLLSSLDKIECLAMGDSNYILLELPSFKMHAIHFTIIHQLITLGYRIIIAHFEKFDYLINDTNMQNQLLDLGLYMQMNASYVISQPKKACRLIAQGKVHIIASDAHNVSIRPCKLKQAYDIVQKKMGNTIAETLFSTNPQHMLNDKPLLAVVSDKHKKRRGLLGFIANL